MIAGHGIHQGHPLRATIDHVIPKHRFGGDEDNTVRCCAACNAVKACMTPTEWAEFRKNQPMWWLRYRFRA
jgi:hypothetical protein